MTIRTVLSGLLTIAAFSTSQLHAQCLRRPVPSFHPSLSFSLQQTRLVSQPILQQEIAPDPNSIHFGACEHVPYLTAKLEFLLNNLCLDLYYNYSHNQDFHATYTEAWSLLQTARTLRVSAHRLDPITAQKQLAGADALLNHVCDCVMPWTRIHRRQVGSGGMQTKMKMVEETLCCLMKDLGVAPTPALDQAPPPPTPIPQGPRIAPAALQLPTLLR